MEVREILNRMSTAGKEAMVCAAAGFGAFFLALLAGADEGIAMFFALTVFSGLGAVALWVWAQMNKQNSLVLGVEIGTVVMVVCGAASLVGALFFSDWLMRYGFWGLIGGLVITTISAMLRPGT